MQLVYIDTTVAIKQTLSILYLRCKHFAVSKRRKRNDEKLSILYLRCHRLLLNSETASDVKLSILYLRCLCCTAWWMALVSCSMTFNSLFEMLDVACGMKLGRRAGLSILYLRCQRLHARRDADETGASFNSLFEMQRRQQAAPKVCTSGKLSILYLRCPPQLALNRLPGVFGVRLQPERPPAAALLDIYDVPNSVLLDSFVVDDLETLLPQLC